MHDLHVWTLTSGVHAMSVHVLLAEGASPETVLTTVQQRVTADFQIAHTSVQIETQACAASETHL